MRIPSSVTVLTAALAAVLLIPAAAPAAAPHHRHAHAHSLRLHAARAHAAAPQKSVSSGASSQAQSSEVEAEGTITAVSAGSLTIQLHESSASMTFVVPAGFDLGGAQVGDLADAKGLQAADGTITLTQLEVQSSGNPAPPAQGGEVEAEGTITAVSAGSLTIQQHESSTSVTFVVPAGFDLGGAQVGDLADAKGLQAADGTITLTELEVQGSDSGDQQQGDQGDQQQGSGDQGDQQDQQQGSGDQQQGSGDQQQGSGDQQQQQGSGGEDGSGD